MPPAASSPARVSRRAILRRVGIGLGIPGAAAMYATQIEPFWPEFHEVPMAIPRLAPALRGLRIAHLTDLHISSPASRDLARRIVRTVNQLAPDMTVVTGDLVTQGKGWIDEACEVVSALRSPVFVSLGNHDYGQQDYNGRCVETSDELTRLLLARGCTVLRNQYSAFPRGGARLWMVGLEDLSSRHFAPTVPVVPDTEPVLALSHNPDTALTLDHYGVSWTLSGHTHGGQVRIPGIGALILPVQNRQFQAGSYRLARSSLYVSRGIGFLMKMRIACRPEVPLYVMQ